MQEVIDNHLVGLKELTELLNLAKVSAVGYYDMHGILSMIDKNLYPELYTECSLKRDIYKQSANDYFKAYREALLKLYNS